MKKTILAVLICLALLSGSAYAVTLLRVPQGGTGVGSVTADSYLKGAGTGALVARTVGEVKTDLSLNNVENTALSTGNAGTATSLASNPTDCGANTWATTIDAEADLTCSAVTYAGISSTTSLNWKGIVSDETGSGLWVFGTSPSIGTPTLVLQDGNGAAPTVDGRIKFDRTTERLEVGNGASTEEFVSVGTLTDTKSCTWDAAGKEIDCDTTAGVGDVVKVGTPADSQVGVWTGDGTIEGAASLTYDGSNLQFTGDIGSMGVKITKGWFTNLMSSNTITGSVSGNAGTATALASNPTDCGANNYAYAIAASGNLTCSTIDISASTNLAAGRSLTLSDDSVAADAETYVYKSKIAFEDPTATDDFFFGEIATAVTFTSIYCKTLVGTVNLDVTIAGTDINGTDITCTTAGVLDSSLGGDTAGAVGEELKLAITSVATEPTYLFLQINGTYND